MSSKYFDLHELFPKELYYNLKDQVPEEVMWRMVNPKLITLIDKIKEKFPEGSTSINDYAWSGDREWSGLRTEDSPWYSATSQHTTFDAIDCVFSKYTTDKVREHILNNQDEFEEIGGIELGTTWCHFDVRDRRDGKIVTFTA